MPRAARLYILAGLLATTAIAQPGPGRPAAAPDQPEPAASDVRAPIETADDLLIALETVDADLHSLTTDIRWAQTFSLAGDEQLRTGHLSYRVTPPDDQGLPPQRAFAVEFSQKWVGARIASPERIDYVFDGEWFLERIHADHQAFKRQVVPPGQRADPLRIGEGPFPIPVGQKRDEILARFTAELIDPVADLDPRLVEFVQDGAGTFALELVPHPDLVEDTTWRRIRIWYDRDTLEPRLAWTINAAEDESYVQLLNIKRDVEIDEGVFSTSVPMEGWELFVTPWTAPLGG